MDELLSQQTVAMHAIDRALGNLKKIGRANWTYGSVRNRLQTLKDNYARCKQLDAKLLNLVTTELQRKNQYFFDNRFKKLEDTYLCTADFMADVLAEFELPSEIPGSTVSHTAPSGTAKTVQALALNSPNFSGTFAE